MKRARILALVAGGALELGALGLLLRGSAIAAPLALHALGAAAWGFGAVIFLPPAQRRAGWMLTGAALLFPVLGPLVSLDLVQLLHRPAADRSAARYLVWNDQPQGDWTRALPAGVSGQSIVEILQSPRTQLRRNAVLALRDLEPEMAIPLLRKGLQDSDEQVRIYAQNILSAMLERFEGGIKELEQRVRQAPDASIHAVRLAEQYFELVYLDVAGDDETAAHSLAKAQALLQQAAKLAPQDPAIPFLGLKYALGARAADAARAWLARLEPLGADERQLLPWRMELAFLEGDWPRLQNLFQQFLAARTVNPRIEAIVEFWRGAQEGAA